MLIPTTIHMRLHSTYHGNNQQGHPFGLCIVYLGGLQKFHVLHSTHPSLQLSQVDMFVEAIP